MRIQRSGLVCIATLAMLGGSFKVMGEEKGPTVEVLSARDGKTNLMLPLINTNVRFKDGGIAGKIADFVVSDQGVIEYMVVRVDRDYFLLPYSAARTNFQDQSVSVPIDRKDFQRVNTFTASDFPDFQNPRYQQQLFDFWGVPSASPLGTFRDGEFVNGLIGNNAVGNGNLDPTNSAIRNDATTGAVERNANKPVRPGDRSNERNSSTDRRDPGVRNPAGGNTAIGTGTNGLRGNEAGRANGTTPGASGRTGNETGTGGVGPGNRSGSGAAGPGRGTGAGTGGTGTGTGVGSPGRGAGAGQGPGAGGAGGTGAGRTGGSGSGAGTGGARGSGAGASGGGTGSGGTGAGGGSGSPR